MRVPFFKTFDVPAAMQSRGTREETTVATQALLLLNNELKAMAHLSRSLDFFKPLDEAQRRGGLREFLKLRDGPFQPAPFGPRSKPRDS